MFAHENVYIQKINLQKMLEITTILTKRASELHERAINSKKISQRHLFFRRM